MTDGRLPALRPESLDAYHARYPDRPSALYGLLLALVAGSVVALFLVRVDVGVRAPGIVRPSVERHAVTSAVAGEVVAVRTRRDALVRAGDTLLVLDGAGARRGLARAASALRGARADRADLESFLPGYDTSMPGRLRTARRRRERQAFDARLRIADAEVDARLRERNRQALLADRGYAARSGAEDAADRLGAARAQRLALIADAEAEWARDLDAVVGSIAQLVADSTRLARQVELHVVRAPVGGNVDELVDVSPGSWIGAGEELAVVSPSAPVRAEVFVDPGDVGLVRAGMPVRLRIETFDARDWGALTGRVLDVSSDVLETGERLAFRVVVSLGDGRLRLRNGHSEAVRKGMTLDARFVVARRSLFQLLRDDVADWVGR